MPLGSSKNSASYHAHAHQHRPRWHRVIAKTAFREFLVTSLRSEKRTANIWFKCRCSRLLCGDEKEGKSALFRRTGPDRWVAVIGEYNVSDHLNEHTLATKLIFLCSCRWLSAKRKPSLLYCEALLLLLLFDSQSLLTIGQVILILLNGESPFVG